MLVQERGYRATKAALGAAFVVSGLRHGATDMDVTTLDGSATVVLEMKAAEACTRTADGQPRFAFTAHGLAANGKPATLLSPCLFCLFVRSFVYTEMSRAESFHLRSNAPAPLATHCGSGRRSQCMASGADVLLFTWKPEGGRRGWLPIPLAALKERKHKDFLRTRCLKRTPQQLGGHFAVRCSTGPAQLRERIRELLEAAAS